MCHEGAAEELGREGIAEELGREGAVGEALGLRAGFFGMDFLGLTEASVAVAVAESSLNFFTASLACLANLPWRLAHSSGCWWDQLLGQVPMELLGMED